MGLLWVRTTPSTLKSVADERELPEELERASLGAQNAAPAGFSRSVGRTTLGDCAHALPDDHTIQAAIHAIRPILNPALL
jgi:hypothetical protein